MQATHAPFRVNQKEANNFPQYLLVGFIRYFPDFVLQIVFKDHAPPLCRINLTNEMISNDPHCN
jgi:hypothetical protein